MKGVTQEGFSMDQITIQIKDHKKARVLVSFLKTLDFVEKITSADLPVVEPGIEEQDTGFFALSGIWAKRDITLDSLRQSAWPECS
jgi:hypothetical protein